MTIEHHFRNARDVPSSVFPRAIIHKQILDAAGAAPTASIEELADEVSAATPALVERVLDEYGDPAPQLGSPDDSELSTTDELVESSISSTSTTENTMAPHDTTTGINSLPDPEQLTDKQLATLQAIREHPEATQRELATILGVSAPTVSQRVNALDGFEWATRQLYVDALLEEMEGIAPADYGEESHNTNDDLFSDKIQLTSNGKDASTTYGIESIETQLRDLSDRLECLTVLLEELHQQFDAADIPRQHPVITDPELTHKVLTACLKADHISEEEELRLVKALVYQSAGRGQTSTERTGRDQSRSDVDRD